MKESQLIAAINRPLVGVYTHSNTGASMSTNGLPDRYYDGIAGDLWVEYKMLRHMPRSGIVVGEYSALQLHWMKRRFVNSGNVPNVVGIVGLPNKTAVIQRTPSEWEEGSHVDLARPRKEVSIWIQEVCSDWSARLRLLRLTSHS